jgi:hypothetical protein
MAEPRGAPRKSQEELPYHIITSNNSSSCNHGDNLPYIGVRVAHSLQELLEHFKHDSGIVVSQTLGDKQARDEAAEYASKERILRAE